MKLKQRIKGAIFAFFKDEILKSFAPPNDIPQFTGEIFKSNTYGIELRQIGCEIDLSIDTNRPMNVPIGLEYEMACNKARRELFEEFIKYIQIDGQVLIDPEYYTKRRIILNAWVGVDTNKL